MNFKNYVAFTKINTKFSHQRTYLKPRESYRENIKETQKNETKYKLPKSFSTILHLPQRSMTSREGERERKREYL